MKQTRFAVLLHVDDGRELAETYRIEAIFPDADHSLAPKPTVFAGTGTAGATPLKSVDLNSLTAFLTAPQKSLSKDLPILRLPSLRDVVPCVRG